MNRTNGLAALLVLVAVSAGTVKALSCAALTEVRLPDIRIQEAVASQGENEYLPYRPGEATAAYSLPGHDAGRIVLVAGDESSQVAIHEYVHLLLRHSSLRIPWWLNEGLAELYSTMRRVGGKVVVGDAPPGRIATLGRERWEPLEQVLVAGREHYTEEERAGIFYAESWALTHMLLLSQEYRAGATRVVQLLTAGTPSEAALEEVYGIPTEELQRDLQSYVRQGRLMGLVFDVKLEQSAERPSTEPVEGLEVGLMLADLLADIKKTEEAGEMI